MFREEGGRVGNHGWVGITALLTYCVVDTGRLVHWEDGSVSRRVSRSP